MAYAIKYLFKFESSNGTTREIRVLQDGYTGEVSQRPLGRAPILKKQQNGPVHGTSLEFYAECHVDREFIEFYTSDPKAYRVDLYAGATLLWQGYITPELYSEPDIAPPYDVRVVATDGVGELKLYDYAAQGTVTLRALLSGLLARTGLGTDVYLISSLKAGSRGAGALLDMTINLDYMAGKTCYETLTYILDTLHATITWWKGAWILTRETNVTFTNGKVRYFNTAGNSALLADSVQALGRMYVNPAWPVGQLSTVIDPAKNRVAVQAPWHVVTCLQNSDMGSDSDWTKAKNARYETDGYVLPVNVGTGTDETAVISQATSMAGLRVPMSISVKATGAMSEITAQVIGSVLGVLLTYKVGNVTYHLVKGEDGSPTWQQGEEIGTYIPLRGARIDFQQQLVTWNVSRIEAEELSIDNIPPFLQGASFPAGTLTVYILGYCAKVYGATLDVILPKGYQDILRIDNGARGEGSEVEVAIGRETADNAYYAAFLQGLLLDSGNLITSFSDANFPAGMDYLAFIARDYALSVALPRAKVTGTVYLESGIAAPPLVFTKGALNYWLQTWSWNLKEDELEIDALTLPSASLMVESETILESNGSTVSSADSAGSSGPSSSMGAGTNYFELAADPTLVQLRQAYSYLGPRKGLIFDANEEADTNADFEKVALPGGGYALHSRLPFYSDSFISAGGISSGGGSAGGNATLVAQTYGGTLSATGIEGINFYSKERVDQLLLTAGKVQTVAGVSPTDGDIPVASLQSALGLGAAAAYGVGSVASGNTGLVTGGSVYSAINEAVSSVMKMQGTTTTPLSDGSTTNPVVIDGSSYTAKKGDVVLYDGKEYLWAGSAWEQLGDEASWALKTTSISAGTGLEGGGTLASNRTISINSTYQTYISNGNTAYGWGDWRTRVGTLETNLTALTTRVTTLEGRTNWDTYFGIDDDGNVYVKKNGNTARGFYSYGFVSAGGVSSGGGTAGADLPAVWTSLRNVSTSASEINSTIKIAEAHIPDMASTYGYLKSGDVSGVYLPLAGGTMTGPITFNYGDTTSQSFSTTYDQLVRYNGLLHLNVRSNQFVISKMGTNGLVLDISAITDGANTQRFQAKDGTIALTSDLSDYLPLSAGSSKSLTGSLYAQSIIPATNYTYDLGSASYGWKNATIRQIGARHLDASNEYTGDHALYIGYGSAMSYTSSTKFYRSTGTAGTETTTSRSLEAEVNENGFYVADHLGVYGQNTSYRLYVNGTSYLNGAVTTPSLAILGGIKINQNLVLGSGTGGELFWYNDRFYVESYDRTNDIHYHLWLSGSAIVFNVGPTTASEKMRIDTNGYVRIGATTYTPAADLTVDGGLDVCSSSSNEYGGAIGFNRKDKVGGVYNSNLPGWQIHNHGYLAFYVEGSGTYNDECTTIDKNGNISSVGSLSTGGNIDATGTIHSSTGIYTEGYVSAGVVASSSDERLKLGIKDFGYSAEMLMALRAREWDWNEKSYMKGHAAGVVAQELQQVMPYAIVERQYLSVNYDMLHGLEIAGLQDHETRIRQLERENAELKRRLNMN